MRVYECKWWYMNVYENVNGVYAICPYMNVYEGVWMYMSQYDGI